MESCVLCGHRCGVNRVKGQRGKCQAGILPVVASSCVHRGEEPMISGSRGSGTIFFAHCCLRCVFCQNFAISQLGEGRELGTEELVGIMIKLQTQGVHNINLVSPTHYGSQILAALKLARKQGLKIPIVYNTGGYDSIELLRALDGQIDIYLPDLKYFDDVSALKYSGAKNYVETAKTGIKEMFRQVGVSKIGDSGIGVRGLLVRHLVLPNDLSQSKEALDFLASISKDIWVSLMAQYSPQFRARQIPELARRLEQNEYRMIVEYAQEIGLHNLYTQKLESSDVYLPDFKKVDPFKL